MKITAAWLTPRPFLLPKTVLGSFRYADWNGAFAEGSILGVVIEMLKSLSGFNTWPFFVEREQGWSKKDILSLLDEYDIKTWGWGVSLQNEFFFRTKKRQAHWIQDIFLKKGVPVRGKLLTSKPVTKKKGKCETRTHFNTVAHSVEQGHAPPHLKTTTFDWKDQEVVWKIDQPIVDFADHIGKRLKL